MTLKLIMPAFHLRTCSTRFLDSVVALAISVALLACNIKPANSQVVGKSIDSGHAMESPVSFALATAQITKDPFTVVDLSTALIRAERFDEAIELARAIKFQRSSNIQESCLSAVALALAEAGQYSQAIEVAMLNEDNDAGVQTLLGLAERLTENGKKTQALATLKRAVDEARKLKEEQRSSSLIEITYAMADAGDQQGAWAILKEIDVAGGEYEVASALASLGKVKEAVAIVDDIPEPWSRSRLLQQVAAKFLEVGNKDQALAILERSLEASIRIEDDPSKANDLEMIAIAFAEAGEPNRAVRIAKEVIVNEFQDGEGESHGTRPWQSFQLGSFARALAYAGFEEEATEIAREIKNKNERAETLKSIPLAKEEARMDAEFAEMTQRGELPETSPFSSISKNQVEKLLAMAETKKTPAEKAEHLLLMVSMLDEVLTDEKVHNLHEDALKVAGSIEEPSRQAAILNRISVAWEASDPDKALVIFEQAIHAGLKIENRNQRLRILVPFAVRLATEPIDESQEQRDARIRRSGGMSRDIPRRVKNTFQPKEQDLAEQIIEGLLAEK